MEHNWVTSRIGHGETMCSKCGITNREAAALGELNKCTSPPPKPANQSRKYTQDEIDAMIDEQAIGEDAYEYDCGLGLDGQCSKAGSEECDWECPNSHGPHYCGSEAWNLAHRDVPVDGCACPECRRGGG